eukprot:TRINITY_DN97640_c0_g1_i1.p1 TRINITY_DN97640_c0_g1~~TRINITY_DN97640_c0_g1_i1.p1  ORF type:complete len:413 (+),score=74.63 TRINITY_DN97640_c0_g1_i1:87-1325(+)
MKLASFVAVIGVAAGQHDRLDMIAEIQKTPGLLWKAGINTRFEHQPIGAAKILLGVKPEAMASRAAYAKTYHPNTLTSEAIPESFDSQVNWPHCSKVIGDIRDQSMCGCCWAFAAASAASDRLCIATNASTMVPLSAEDVCFCASDDGCQGGDISGPWDYIQSQGAVTGGQFKGSGPFGEGFCQDFSLPHCHHHGPQGDDPYPAEGTKGCPQQQSPQCPTACDSAAKAPHDVFKKDKWSFAGETASASGENDIARAIMAGGPVETAFSVYDDFENYVSGIYHHVKGDMGGGHAVRIVGWGVDGGVKYWKVANSWNPHWGESGYFRIKRGNNECGIEDQVTFSPSSAKWSQGGGPSPPGPKPGCADTEDSSYCGYTKTADDCKFNWSKCKKTCGCCDASPPGYCFGMSPSVVV